MTVIFQNDRYSVPKWPLFLTKMTVVWPKWPLYSWLKWPLVYHQNDRCMTKMTVILDQNDRFQNDRYWPKWPLVITKMTVFWNPQQNDRYLMCQKIIWKTRQKSYLKNPSKWPLFVQSILSVILISNDTKMTVILNQHELTITLKVGIRVRVHLGLGWDKDKGEIRVRVKLGLGWN